MKQKSLTSILILAVLFVLVDGIFACENELPTALLSCEPQYVGTGGEVTLDGSASYDPDGSITKWEIDWDGVGGYNDDEVPEDTPPGDGIFDHTYNSAGVYTAKLRVTDNEDATSTDTCTVTVRDIVYVDADAAGGDGTSWDKAYKSLQDGITAAVARGADYQVWVAEGTYKPAGISRSGTFSLTNSVSLYGGFRGNETELNQRDWKTNETILSGDIGELGDSRDNCYHVVELGSNATIDGLTITGGRADNDDRLDPVENGGGISSDNDNSLTLRNCIISNNLARRGGGVYLQGGTNSIQDCVFRSNSGRAEVNTTSGGGMYANTATLTIEGCLFENNASDKIGSIAGALYVNQCTAAIDSCVFRGNVAGKGGALYTWGGTSLSLGLDLVNCVFVSNKTYATGKGGAAYINTSANDEVSIRFCTFYDNYAHYDGGALMLIKDTDDVDIVNNIFWDNDSRDGHQVVVQGSQLFEHCDITDGLSDGVDCSGCTGDDILNVEPDFADVGNIAGPDGIYRTKDDGLRLKTNSDLIDAGESIAGIDNDIIGNPRSIDGKHNDLVLPDIGAYELERIWYVKETGSGNGHSWANAALLQDAISSSAAYDEIWVARGTHKPDRGSGITTGDRTKSFVLKNGVGIYGGFAGTEVVRFDRPCTVPETQTVLSGDIDGGSADSFHVAMGCDGGLLDGFKIEKGNANGSGDNSLGGGMLNVADSPTLTNCTFANNSAVKGGGMYNASSSSPTLTKCVFENNTAGSDGGAMCNYNYDSLPTLLDCSFIGNSAGSNGGAISNSVAASPTITNCLFKANNNADYGGAVYNNGGSPVITNCVFADSDADYHGGAIYNISCSPRIINSTFWGNYAPKGGGMYNHHSSTVATNCIFWGNSAVFGDEIYNLYSQPKFIYCDIEDSGGSSSWDSSLGVDGGGNIDDDPEFLDADGDNFWLMCNSPCVDSADGDAAPPADITGQVRLDVEGVNNGTGDPDYADIGAYEYPDLYPCSPIRVYTSSAYSDNAGYGLGDGQVHFSAPAGAYPDLYIEVDRAGGNPGQIDEPTLTITSDSDSTGFSASFTETGANTNRYRIDSPIHLATATSAGTRQLKVINEETIYVDSVAGPKVDRGDIMTLTSKLYEGTTHQTRADDTADEIDGAFNMGAASPDWSWWNAGDPRAAESTDLQTYVKDAGEDPAAPADILFVYSHGLSGGVYEGEWGFPTWDVMAPGLDPDPLHSGGNHVHIEDTDWEKDIEWAIFYSCNIFGDSIYIGGIDDDHLNVFDPEKYITYWDDALIRTSSQNNCHGILASSAEMLWWKEIDGFVTNAALIHMQGFFELLKQDETLIDAYMESALDPALGDLGGVDWRQYGAAALFHVANVEDRINNVTRDTTDTEMYYTWYVAKPVAGPTDTAYGGTQLVGNAKVVCEIPTEQPELKKVRVKRESHAENKYKRKGFAKRIGAAGRVRLNSTAKQAHWKTPTKLNKGQAKKIAADFIEQSGGGLPADANLTNLVHRNVVTYDGLKPQETAEGFVHTLYAEFGHSFDGIDIASGGRGDSILVKIRDNKPVGVNRHWREVIGPVGAAQQVISAEQALAVAVENIPKVIMVPPSGFTITQIKLFYHGLPSDRQDQYLSPAWGFRVGNTMWVYVDAFTGKFLD